MKNWLNNLFTKSKTEENTDYMKKFLIVGLGNIGAEYVNTRHNIGFKVLDYLAKKENLDFQTVKLGSLAEYKFKGRSFFLLKPNTYMNLSGKAVQYWMEKEKIPLENLFVITDDLNLPFGTIRIKPKGSDGGHNGLKNIDQLLGGNNYARLRIGIGNEFHKGQQINYVLGKWSREERDQLPELLKKAADGVKAFGTIGVELAMNQVNK